LQPITITLDGNEVSGYAGMSILALAREAGVHIATLCHDDHLPDIGACRLCIVEEEKTGALMAACVTPIASGMVINTHSPRVIAHRKTIVQLMLASHPDACPVCDKGNRCQLRGLAAEMGISLTELHRIPQAATIQDVNPFIQRDLSKCVLCAKCIRACQEMVVEGVLDYFQRGFKSKPATFADLPLEMSGCTFCGACVALCPTGAIMEKDAEHRGTTGSTVKTTCPYCGCGCSIELEVKGERVVRSTPPQLDGTGYRPQCVRGSYGYDFIHNPERLTRPLMRKDGSLVESDWGEALALVARRLKEIEEKYGADSIAVLGSAHCTNEEAYLLQSFARRVIGTGNVDAGSRLYNAATILGLLTTIGLPQPSNLIEALEKSDVIMVVGADPASSAPQVGYAIKRAVKSKGATLILIDPRSTKLAFFATLHLQPRPGTDLVLLAAIAYVIVKENLLDREFVMRRTDNFEPFAKSLDVYTPEYAASITGVPVEQIAAAARLYARGRQASIVYGSGITQYTTGTDCVRILANLALLTGNAARKGGCIIPLHKESNSYGVMAMGLSPRLLPGLRSVTDRVARENFETLWRVRLPASPELTAVEMLQEARSGRIKAMYILGEDPVSNFPNRHLVTEALNSLEFLAVQDIFLTEAAKLATVVLPGTSFAEKDGTVINFEGKIKKFRKAVTPSGESRPDWEILLEISSRMGRPLPFFRFEDIVAEMEEGIPGYHYYGSDGKSFEVSWASAGSQRPFDETPLGFPRFWPLEYKTLPDKLEQEYPFFLLTGGAFPHPSNGIWSLKAPRLKKFLPQGHAELNPEDAHNLTLDNGDMVRITSAAGELVAPVRLSSTVPRGILFLPCSFPQIPANQLFDINMDPQSKTPAFKCCRVRVKRADQDGWAIA